MLEFALGQQVALENRIDRLEIEFGGHVADGAIFVIEFLGLVRTLAITIDQMLEHFPMAHHVIAEVHRHETGELQEAGIDAAPGARIPGRNRCDHIFLEPCIRPRRRVLVDSGGRLARVDRSAHHRQRARAALVLVGRHDGCGGEARNRRLAHREHMRARPDMLEPADQIVDIIVEIEFARFQRDVAGIAPVGDPHVMVGDHPLDRAA